MYVLFIAFEWFYVCLCLVLALLYFYKCLILDKLNGAICFHVFVWMIDLLASSPVNLFSPLFWGAEGSQCLQEVVKLELVLSKLGFKIIKSRTSVFKHLNISKLISMLNFQYVFILLLITTQ